MSGSPIRFDISINHLYAGMKLLQGDPRWRAYTKAFRRETHTIDSLIAAISQGLSFAPVMKDNYRKRENFISAQHAGLDDDRGTPESSLEALAADNFTAHHAAFLYSTHSSTPEHPKSRIVFVFDKAMIDRAQYRLIQRALAWKYNFTDQSVAEESRFFYGAIGCRMVKLGNILTVKALEQDVIEPYLIHLQEQAQASRQLHHVPDYQQVVGSAGAEWYVNRAIQEEVSWLSTRLEGTGERHRGLLVAAIKLQSLRLADWLPVDIRESINPYALLIPATRANGYWAKYGEKTVCQTIADGIGYARPRPIPESWTTTTTPKLRVWRVRGGHLKVEVAL